MFMDVFTVTDQDGNKITEEEVLDYIHKALGPNSNFTSTMRRSVGVKLSTDCTSIELIGSDWTGLLSEVSAVVTHLKFNVVNVEVWTHNTRATSVMQVTDEKIGAVINDLERLSMIKKLLWNVLNGSTKSKEAKTVVSYAPTHPERRLHQMMFADRDYETTRGGKAVNTFYVRDALGYPINSEIIDSIRQVIGQVIGHTILQVKGNPEELNQVSQESPTRFLFRDLFKSRPFCNFGLVRSYT